MRRPKLATSHSCDSSILLQTFDSFLDLSSVLFYKRLTQRYCLDWKMHFETTSAISIEAKRIMVVNTIWAATWQNQQNESAPREDSDMPGHPSSLIRVFAVRMKKAWVLSYPELSIERTAKTLIRLGGYPGWSESSLNAHSFYWFCRDSCTF